MSGLGALVLILAKVRIAKVRIAFAGDVSPPGILL